MEGDDAHVVPGATEGHPEPGHMMFRTGDGAAGHDDIDSEEKGDSSSARRVTGEEMESASIARRDSGPRVHFMDETPQEVEGRQSEGRPDEEGKEPKIVRQARRDLSVYRGRLPRREREGTRVMRIDSSAGRAVSTGESEEKPKNPIQIIAELMAEMHRKDGDQARVLRMRVADGTAQAARDEEKERWTARAARRRKRQAQRRRVKKIDVTPETLYRMPEPTPNFREAMTWSVHARDALREVEAREEVLTDGFGKLALSEAERLESLAAGDVVGDNDTRAGVVQQLITAAAGLRLIAADDWSDKEDTPLGVSRARRRFAKRVRKARAKVLRDRRQQTETPKDEASLFVPMDELQRKGRDKARRLSREEAEAAELVLPHAAKKLEKIARSRQKRHEYHYHSGSSYQLPEVKKMAGVARPVRVGKLRAACAPAMDLLPTARVEVRGSKQEVKIDTGAQYSVAGRTWMSLGTKLQGEAPVDYMEGFSGVAVRVLGVWRFNFQTQYQQRMQVDALIVDSETTDFLVGEDWMYSKGVKIDFVASEMKWYANNEKVIVPFTGIGAATAQSTRTARVRLMKQAKVVTQTMHHLHLAVPAPDGEVGVFTPTPRRERHLLLAPTVATVRDGEITVPVLSLAGRTTKLPTREALGTWAPARDELELLEVNGELNRDNVRQWIVEVLRAKAEPLSNEDELSIGSMEKEDRELLLQLLRNYPKTTEPRTGCPPMTSRGVEHEIHTGDAPPIKVRPRRHAHTEYEVIDENVGDMLKNDVVERGHGAWGFPVVLVKKKDGSIRFCIDYRLLSAVTRKDVYPLPRIDETLEHLHGSRRFSSLDLHAGYWQIPVAEKDRDKTGFITRQGLFRFVRMVFGLANAPGTFQRMMDAVLRGLTWQCCLVYLDDVIIFTQGSMTRHIVALACVLERLAKAGLSLKTTKCSFAQTRLEYLGHELDGEGIRPMTSLVRSVSEFPVPKDEKAVKRFVHLAGYYRRFVANFGTKAAPMTKLLRKNTDWEWGDAQQCAFEGLKKELTERPLLAYPDFSKPFKLVTDASKVGLGAVLMQDQGCGDQPVAYASKVNSPTVSRYSITDLECAAVVWAVKLFRPYLYGGKFELVTDHSALSWLMRSKDLAGRLHRWSLQLQEYNFNITYRPGSTNVCMQRVTKVAAKIQAIQRSR